MSSRGREKKDTNKPSGSNKPTPQQPRPTSSSRRSPEPRRRVADMAGRDSNVYGNQPRTDIGTQLYGAHSDDEQQDDQDAPPVPLKMGVRSTGSPDGQGPSRPEDGSEERQWDILTGFLKLTSGERDTMIDGQIRTINPTNINMVKAALMGKMKKSQFDATTTLVKLMAYEGFNPVVVINQMSERAASWNGTTRTGTYDLSLDGVAFSLTEKANLSVDVLFLSMLFLTRGNNLRKILASIDKNVKTPLLIKIQTYSVKSDTDEDVARRKRSEKIDLSAKDVTLSRITASFPQIALAAVAKTGVKGKVEMTCTSIQYRIDNGRLDEVPAILTHGLIPSLIPKECTAELLELKQFCYFFNIEQSITLQMPNVKKNIVNEPILRMREASERFVHAAMQGPLNSDESRHTLLKSLGLNPASGTTKKWISAGAKLWMTSSQYGSYYMLQTQLSMAMTLRASSEPRTDEVHVD